MQLGFRLSLFFCVAAAQYVAVGEPNPNAPTSPDEVPSCPEDPPIPVPLPPPIQSAFETVFRNIDVLIYAGIDSVNQQQQRYAIQIKHNLKHPITANVEPFLDIAFQLGTNLWRQVVANAIEVVAEFTKMFDTSFSFVKRNIRLVNEDPVAKKILEGIDPVTDQIEIDYANNARTYSQYFVEHFSKYANYVQQLHQRALASSSPKQLQQEFEITTDRFIGQMDLLLQSYSKQQRYICDIYRFGIRSSAATLRDFQVSAVTSLLT